MGTEIRFKTVENTEESAHNLVFDHYTANTLAKAALKAVRKCFENPDNRSEFEAWYLEKYKSPYVWKGAMFEKEKTNDTSDTSRIK